eukprot:COSAG02_NODE_515_length_20817_cov_61.106960_8_plen_690_part_00
MDGETSSDSDAEQVSGWGGQAAGSFGAMGREHDSDSSVESSEDEEWARSERAGEELPRRQERQSDSSTESSEDEDWMRPEWAGRPEEGASEVSEGDGRGDRAKLELRPAQETYGLFQKFATNRTGTVSFDDVRRAVHELWPHFDHALPLQRAYEAADRDANGSIGRREFHLLLSNIVHFDALWGLFDTIEAGNPENRMELEDFQAACAAVGLATSEDATAEFEACTQAEGVAEEHLGFDHFCDWMLKQKRQAQLISTPGKTRRPKPAPPARKPAQSQPIGAKVGSTSHRLQQDSETESDDGDEDGVLSDAVRQQSGKPVLQDYTTSPIEPEPEPVYDSDSSGSELSDDDAAVALLARIQNSPYRVGGTPVRDDTPVKLANTASAQARLSQLLDELGSPPSGRGAARSRRRSSKAAQATAFDVRSATPRKDEMPRAMQGSEQQDSVSDAAVSGGGLEDSSIHDRLYAAESSSPEQRRNNIHDRLYALKTASTSADPHAKVNLAKHGLSKEAMEMRAKAQKLKADTRAEERAMDEKIFREDRQRAAKERQEAKEQRVRAMRIAAMADKKLADDLKLQREVQQRQEKEAIRSSRREALEEAKALKRQQKKEEEEILKERRAERERQAAIDAKVEEQRRNEKRREMLLRREHVLQIRQQKQAAAMQETAQLFESRIDAKAAAEVRNHNPSIPI